THTTARDRSPITVSLSDPNWAARLAVVLAGLLAFRIVALALNRTDLFFDESQYWSWSLEPAFGYYSKPPLVAWIVAAATAVCGDSEFCIRLPSPILHTLTAVLLYPIGRRLYSQQVGFWSAVAYATLPAVSLSAGIISTDVPLLSAWALALLFFALWIERPSWGRALVLGTALGLGLNAKYAMLLFVPCAVLYFILVPERRDRLRDPSLWGAFLVGLLAIAPNLWWNLQNGLATFAHTADNAKWTGRLFRPEKAAEFFLAQFGVMGPVLFAAFLAFLWRTRRHIAALAESDRLLVAFSTPIVLLFTLQGFISRAHANWAATAYVAATVLVVAVLIRAGDWRWIKASFALHLAVALLIAFGTWRAGTIRLPGVGDPFARTLGWRQLADTVRQTVLQTRERPFAAIVVDERATMAALLYYFQDRTIPVYAWRSTPKPRHHYELTRSYDAKAGEPALLVSLDAAAAVPIVRAFARSEALAVRNVPAGQFANREVHLFAVSGYQGK
ncbi:MAG: ArnT family glycosyltransferase, partial [Hyphomicrobiaceae bacterium]